MARPLVWPTASIFYPIGDTPPVNLRQHCSATNVDFLLLGCGDPRHILYTIYAGGNGELTQPQALTFLSRLISRIFR